MKVEVINCPDCKYYYAPVCTFYPQLPMTSRKGFCYHAIRGTYEGPIPTVKEKYNEINTRATGTSN